MKSILFGILLCVSIADAAPPNEPGTLISRPVGEVDDHIVTSREVQLNYLIERALILGPTQFLAKSHRLDIDSRAFQRELVGVFMEWVVDLQAQTMKLTKVDDGALAQAKKLVFLIEKADVWPDVKASREEIDRALLRKLRAKQFIKKKSESSQVEPTDEEVREFYEQNRERFGSLKFEPNIERIRALKRRKDANDRLQSWFANLRKQYKVKSYLTSGS